MELTKLCFYILTIFSFAFIYDTLAKGTQKLPTASLENTTTADKLFVYPTTILSEFNDSSSELTNVTNPFQNPLPAIFGNMFNPDTNSTSSLPVSLMAMQGKRPGGMQNSMLTYLMGGNSPDLKSLTGMFMGLAPKLPSVLKEAMRLNTSTVTGVGQRCYEEINTYIEDLMSGKMWALKMMDASGKPGPSIMDGNVRFWGNFDECLDVVSDVTKGGLKIKGDTCDINLTPPPQLMGVLASQAPATSQGAPVVFYWHLCLPDTCSGRVIQPLFNESLSQYNISVAKVTCHSDIKIGPVSDDPRAVGAIVLVAILGFLVLLGSALDLNIRASKCHEEGKRAGKKTTVESENACSSPKLASTTDKMFVSVNGNIDSGIKANGLNLSEADGKNLPTGNGEQLTSNNLSKGTKTPVWQRLLLCFSAVTNGEKILSVKHSPGTLTCLNGIRVLSICWVILGHTFGFLMAIADNPLTAGKLMNKFSFQILLNATLSVDSFFVLSGLLGTYLFLRETEKAGGLRGKHMVMYYVHRYLRLTPTYAFVIFINTCLVSYFGDGPTWNGPPDKEFCRKNWWTSLIYINNLYRPDAECVGWGWYLANDMQFYIVAPLALVPFAFRKKRGVGCIMKILGFCVTGAFVAISIICTGYFAYKAQGSLLGGNMEFFRNVYIKPWCRIGPFAIGMEVGYILHATKSKIRMSTFVSGICWLFALMAALACMFATYDERAPGRSLWGPGANAAHEALYRPAWGMVLGWVILACCTGKAGIINWILSWDWWQPLARLTYGAYLVHLIVMEVLNANTAKTLIHFTADYIVLLFLGYVCLSYIFAFIIAILVEAPLLQLEKLLLK